MATSTIDTLPTLLPQPSHANIHALESVLFKCLETLQSSQSEEWGFCRLAKQPAEYALKSALPWVNVPNYGPHQPIGLTAQATQDAEATYNAEKPAWQAQATVTRAINAALYVAVPKVFWHNSTPMGGNIIGTMAYCSNHNPCNILLALCTSTAHLTWPNTMPTTASLPCPGIQPNQSRHTLTASKTATLQPSLHCHPTPLNR